MLLPFEDCALFAFEDCGLFALLFELPVERAADDLERDELDRDLVVALLELAPDLLVPFLDVEAEREVEPPARFACVRPRLLPRRDWPDWLATAI